MSTKRLFACAFFLGPLTLAIAMTAGCPGSLDLTPYEEFDGGGGHDAGKTTSSTKASSTHATTSATGAGGGGDAGTDGGTGGATGAGGADAGT